MPDPQNSDEPYTVNDVSSLSLSLSLSLWHQLALASCEIYLYIVKKPLL